MSLARLGPLAFLALSVAAPAGAQTPPSDRPAVKGEAVYLDAEQDQVYRVSDRQPLSREELYRLVGREDLLARDEQLRKKRLWSALTGTGIAVVGATVGTVVLVSLFDLNDPYCVASPQNYSECAGHHREQQLFGFASIAVGAAGLAVFGSIAYLAHRDLSRPSQTELVNEFNARNVQAPQKPKPESWRITPVLSGSGVGAVAALRF